LDSFYSFLIGLKVTQLVSWTKLNPDLTRSLGKFLTHERGSYNSFIHVISTNITAYNITYMCMSDMLAASLLWRKVEERLDKIPT
jgi:hypothetical protein